MASVSDGLMMACVRDDEAAAAEPAKKRRFHPFRGLKKMFRKKTRRSSVGEDGAGVHIVNAESTARVKHADADSERSRSTGELAARRASCAAGLSLSHDSVFQGDPQQQACQQMDTSASMQMLAPGVSREELVDAVRRRRGHDADTTGDDEDLPGSCSNSATGAATVSDKSKAVSENSLLSVTMGSSSDMDDESLSFIDQHLQKHSSKSSLPGDSTDLGVALAVSAPLSHSAARHKMAVKPKRTHGAPRRRKALPSTPEVNEDSAGTNNLRATLYEVYRTPTTPTATPRLLKSSSLPPGVAPPPGTPLSRSHSTAHPDQPPPEPKRKDDSSFFGRFLARRSANKKKKINVTASAATPTADKPPLPSNDEPLSPNVMHTVLPRSGAASRQRIMPVDIPSSPEGSRLKRQQHVELSPPRKKPAWDAIDSHQETTSLPYVINSFGGVDTESTDSPEPETVTFENNVTNVSINTDEETQFRSTPSIQPVTVSCGTTTSTGNQLIVSIGSSEPPQLNITRVQLKQDAQIPEFLKIQLNKVDAKPLSNVVLSTSAAQLDATTKTETPTPKTKSPPETTNGSSDDVVTVEPQPKITPKPSPGLKPVLVAPEVQPRLNVAQPKDDKGGTDHSEGEPKVTKTEVTETNSDKYPEGSADANTKHTKLLVKSLPEVAEGINFEKTDLQRKFSKEDLEIIDKDVSEEIVEVPTKQPEATVKPPQPRKSSLVLASCQPKPYVRNKSHSLDIPEDSLKSTPELQAVKFLVAQKWDKPKEDTQKWVKDESEPTKVYLQLDQQQETDTKKPITQVYLNQDKPPDVAKPLLVSSHNTESAEITAPRKTSLITSFQKWDKPAAEQDNKPRVKPAASSSQEEEIVESAPKIKSSHKWNRSSEDLTRINSPAQEKVTSVSCQKWDKTPEDQPEKTESPEEKVMTSQKWDKNAEDQENPVQLAEVVMRRKSQSSSQKRDEEPELMKVFARRSLKLKDSETETLSQQVIVLVESEVNSTVNQELIHKSRDSDKENEIESEPQQERKKSVNTKEPLSESKFLEPDVILRKPTPKLLSLFPRIQSLSNEVSSENDLDKRRNKSMIAEANQSKLLNNANNDVDKSNMNNNDSVQSVKANDNKDEIVPRFKRIQQRKEEWEQRAQQAMKKTVP